MPVSLASPDRPCSQPAARSAELSQPDPVLRLSAGLWQRLRCPACGSPLGLAREACACLEPTCAARFDVVAGVALLIDEESSVFSARQALSRLPAGREAFSGRLRRRLRSLLPVLGSNHGAVSSLRTFQRRLVDHSPRPCVLVIGGAWVGAGMQALLADSRIEWVESDVWLSERTQLVCDAHRIPFAQNTFDGVVIQAVLEHVADPQRCVAEIHRVLKPGGLVYAETAFLQQVHAGRHDFCRFTPVGHRRLFRGFEQIAAGAAAGPAVALAWAWQHFLLSFSGTPLARAVATGAAVLTAFWLKYLDSYLSLKPAGLDAASAVFFLGARRETEITDREAIAAYRGAQNDVV